MNTGIFLRSDVNNAANCFYDNGSDDRKFSLDYRLSDCGGLCSKIEVYAAKKDVLQAFEQPLSHLSHVSGHILSKLETQGEKLFFLLTEIPVHLGFHSNTPNFVEGTHRFNAKFLGKSGTDGIPFYLVSVFKSHDNITLNAMIASRELYFFAQRAKCIEFARKLEQSQNLHQLSSYQQQQQQKLYQQQLYQQQQKLYQQQQQQLYQQQQQQQQQQPYQQWNQSYTFPINQNSAQQFVNYNAVQQSKQIYNQKPFNSQMNVQNTIKNFGISYPTFVTSHSSIDQNKILMGNYQKSQKKFGEMNPSEYDKINETEQSNPNTDFFHSFLESIEVIPFTEFINSVAENPTPLEVENSNSMEIETMLWSITDKSPYEPSPTKAVGADNAVKEAWTSFIGQLKNEYVEEKKNSFPRTNSEDNYKIRPGDRIKINTSNPYDKDNSTCVIGMNVFYVAIAREKENPEKLKFLNIVQPPEFKKKYGLYLVKPNSEATLTCPIPEDVTKQVQKKLLEYSERHGKMHEICTLEGESLPYMFVRLDIEYVAVNEMNGEKFSGKIKKQNHFLPLYVRNM